MRLISNLLPADAHLLALVILSNCVLRLLVRSPRAREEEHRSVPDGVANRCSEMGLGIVS